MKARTAFEVHAFNFDLDQCPIERGDILRLDTPGREFQYRIFNDVQRRKPRFIQIVVPGGGGKTTLQEALALKELESSGYIQRQLVLVPQRHIGQQFAKDSKISPDRGKTTYRWRVSGDNNYCDFGSRTVIDALKNWLTRPAALLTKADAKSGNTFGLVAIASHTAFVQAWGELESELSAKKMRGVIRHITLRLDESHHVSWVFDKNEKALSEDQKEALVKEANELGKICQFIVNDGDSTSRICMTTATPYRENSLILTKGLYKKFRTYYHPLSKHWKSLRIREFAAILDLYHGGDPIARVAQRIKAEPNEKHLVVIPALRAKWRKAGSHGKLMRVLHDSFPNKRIVDAVDQGVGKQTEAKKVILTEGEDIDILVICMLGREGTDWVPCSRIHHCAMENSKWLAIQTLYRMMRKHPRKKKVIVRYYVPRFVEITKANSREDFADRVAATFLLSDIEDMFQPWLIDGVELPELRDGADDTEILEAENRVSLNFILGPECRSIQEDVAVALDLLVDDGVRDEASMRKAIQGVLKTQYGKHKDKDLEDRLIRWYLANWLRMAGKFEIAPLVKAVKSLREAFALIKEHKVGNYSVVLGARLTTSVMARLRSIYRNPNSWEAIYRSAING
jgi:hypothetical protein